MCRLDRNVSLLRRTSAGRRHYPRSRRLRRAGGKGHSARAPRRGGGKRRQRGATIFVRINAQPELIRLDAEAACRAGVFGLLVPKTRDARTLQELAELLDGIERSAGREPMAFVPMIEDAGAVLDARLIASATPRVFALMTGGEDLATSLDAEPTPAVLYLPKLLVHLAAKAAGVRSFGLLRTVADYGDLDAVERSAHEAAAFGFDGASCVHPSVVPILNRAFSPSAALVERAE